ncbi:MAG: prenyltransferase [Pontimonas sp.]
MNALRSLVLSSRPLSWVNTAFPFAVAYFVVTQRIDWPLLVGSLFFLIPYNFLMYGINDVFDYESDVRNPRKGGAEGALLPPELHGPTVAIAIGSTVPFVAYLVWVGPWSSWLVLAVSVFAVVAYSVPPLRFKERAVVDSVTSSVHFVSPALYGVALAGGAINDVGWLILAAFFFWGMASHAFGAVQDVIADREAGISSIATVFGARPTVWIAAILYTLAGVFMLLTPWPLQLTAIIAPAYLAAVLPFVTVSDDTAFRANKGWRWFLALNFFSGAVVTLVGINAGYLPG